MDLLQADTQCLVCTRPFSLSSSPPITSLESLAICPDCKQSLQSRPVTPNPTRYHRPRARLTRTESATDYSSDPDSFAQHFSQLINSARRANYSDNDSEMEGSVYGESEMDGSSFGNYGPDSEAYMSDREFFAQLDNNVGYNNESNNGNYNGNYDIDPMNTGLSPSQWDTEEESEWEEISELGETLNLINTPERQNPNPNYVSNPSLSPSLSPSPSPQWLRSRWRMGPLQIDITQPFLGFPDDSINPNLFEELIDELAEDSDVRISGPRATSESFRERIPKVVVTREMMRESGDLICAVCKDEMKAGIRVSKLPCQHMYHDCCINPWLRSRNTCPVCRYELPVDKVEIEMERFEYDSNGEDSDSETEEEEEEEQEDQEIVIRMDGQDRTVDRSEERGGGWVFLGPIVSLVGIVLVLCFKNVNRGNGEDRRRNGEDGGGFVNNRSNLEGRKRWWSIF
ncbi:hypothetical protein LUZ60_015459 [Juncus effusus]|nr:hypothetical protein LUZ60_015459 [Juncus effusus]